MFTPWHSLNRILIQYIRDLTRLQFKFFPTIEDEDVFNFLNRLADLSGNEQYQVAADIISRRMAVGVAKVNADTWREAAKRVMQGRKIFQALKNELHGPVGFAVRRTVQENATLITTLPLRLAEQATEHVHKLNVKGARAEVISRVLKEQFPKIAKSRLELIARTEVGKSNTAITEARAKNVGVRWYQWTTSVDQRVRPSHALMNGVLCSWIDPPESDTQKWPTVILTFGPPGEPG